MNEIRALASMAYGLASLFIRSLMWDLIDKVHDALCSCGIEIA